MSLLKEIQDAAINSNVNLATLLRKCKVLASKLGNTDFKDWVENELNGYNKEEDVPEYRVLRTHAKGHFSGPFGSGLRYFDIPMACVPEEYREKLSKVIFRDSVASLEDLVEGAKKSGQLSANWDPNIVATVGRGIYENQNCIQAWNVIPPSALVSLLDAVRNKILSFALEIEAESPDAGEMKLNSNPVPQNKINHIFNTTIMGNVQNMVTGSSDFTQKAIIEQISPEVFDKLLDALTGIQDKEIKGKAIESIEELKDAYSKNDGIGQKYTDFMALLANHVQVLGPIVAPYLAPLAALINT